ncbi:FAD dependent oxidoreductase [Cordyceps fumosorosea ARSEF 2679]|uniref:FAD dependent oxidoreductase n=1 Tax=Cordyceps fumosorosea (strain ARSEF 2679) TaxID=1081104 RepID=A0A168BAJ6_CORFA|nr:FAD dependent oxidoreductase [Cordyceps fumosorosea ARSEF 2679]OAA69851.1 FAD dependent oxidoreductase [Cordyceps fumosorosea ARSEF 2679]
MEMGKIAAQQLSAGYGAMLGRALHDAAVPVANATISYWMDDPPFPEVNLNAHPLPDIADYVVIGTGLAGLAATRTLLEISHDQRTEMPLRVVALDARDTGAGATGRNGGHVKTAPYRDFAAAKARLGADKARDVLAFMRRHLPLLKEVGRELPQGEVRDVEAVDMFLVEDDFEVAKRLVDDVKANVPDIEITVWPGEEARKQFGCNDFVAGALSYPAGAAFPFRLVTGAWKALVDKYPELRLLSNTPVESVSVAANSPQHPYAVNTPKGTVRARHVLHATNAYAPGLTPRLRSSLTGARGCMSAQDGGSRFPATHGNRSWVAVYQPGFDYVTQRPDGADGTPGDVMVGGGFFRSKLNGTDLLGVWDDSVRDALPLAHVRGIMPTVFQPNWGSGCGGGDRLKKDWTGIMGFTGDELPFVGALPQSITQRQNTYPGAGVPGLEGSGEWIAAGFNGHGMVWAWLSGAAAGIMMAGQDGVDMPKVTGRPAGTLDSWFPRDVLKLDEDRLKRADLKNLKLQE